MHLERMYLLLQRLKRNRNFSRPAFAGLKAGTRPYVEVGACYCGVFRALGLPLRETLAV